MALHWSAAPERSDFRSVAPKHGAISERRSNFQAGPERLLERRSEKFWSANAPNVYKNEVKLAIFLH